MNLNAITWFEIPVFNFERASQFYSQIFNYSMPEMYLGNNRMGILPHNREQNGVGGAIVHGKGYEPSATGVAIYLNANPDMDAILARIPVAGGKIIAGKTPLFEGSTEYFALFSDTEGNSIGLHSIEGKNEVK